MNETATRPNNPSPPSLAVSEKDQKQFWRRGEPLVWLTAAALAAILLLVFILIAVVISGGLGVFWPSAIAEITLDGGQKIFAQIIRNETNPDNKIKNIQLKTANREKDPQRQDFRWVPANSIR